MTPAKLTLPIVIPGPVSSIVTIRPGTPKHIRLLHNIPIAELIIAIRLPCSVPISLLSVKRCPLSWRRGSLRYRVLLTHLVVVLFRSVNGCFCLCEPARGIEPVVPPLRFGLTGMAAILPDHD